VRVLRGFEGFGEIGRIFGNWEDLGR